MTTKLRIQINFLLFGLVVLDLVLCTVSLFFPEIWFRMFHGAGYMDPQGLLRRAGAVWAAFTLFQLVALKRWQTQPYWLVLVAGIRLTEVFSDWVYLYVADSVTWFGRLALVVSPPANVLFAWLLIKSYVLMSKGT